MNTISTLYLFPSRNELIKLNEVCVIRNSRSRGDDSFLTCVRNSSSSVVKWRCNAETMLASSWAALSSDRNSLQHSPWFHIIPENIRYLYLFETMEETFYHCLKTRSGVRIYNVSACIHLPPNMGEDRTFWPMFATMKFYGVVQKGFMIL